MSYKLVREDDGLVKQSKEVLWITFNEEGKFKEKFEEPEVGRSLLMSPFNLFFTWQTTPIVKVIRKTKHTITFKTENSKYKLYKQK